MLAAERLIRTQRSCALVKRALGVCYYPEHWAEDSWQDDARRMREAGITFVRIGEFAWSRLEASPDRLDFTLAGSRN